ncbi:MAG: hypothetical protein KIT84_40580 [Labilithrix sp.]|nr:hypothetical protein [Labilithrix sp.]MCW5817365.1 hypothetical protein [Labilithrix sp.]
MLRARVCALSIVAVALCASGVARADKMTDAEELFRRAKQLMTEKKDKEACPLLEESQKLDPQMGTLLNLATCHENIGRVASAWGEYRAVEQMAKVAGREERIKYARDRAAKLEPRLPRLKIVLLAENKVDGIVVKVDGEVKAESLWSGVAVDPGTSTIETSAPGKTTQTAQVKIEGEGSTTTFTVPKLEDAPVTPPETGVDPAAAEKAQREREATFAANKSRRTKGFIIGGAGVAIAAAGGVFGVLAISKDSDALAACPSPCAQGSDAARAADEATNRALLFANVANVAIPVGLVVALLGGYIALTSGPTSEPAKTATIAPLPGGAALGLKW